MGGEEFNQCIEKLIQEFGVAERRQVWPDGQSYEVEEDSSPSSYAYFQQAYQDSFWRDEYDLDNPCFVVWEWVTEKTGKYNVLPLSHQKVNRLFALSRSWASAPSIHWSRLSGEVDFNFKEDIKDWGNKYGYYREIADGDAELMAMLNACKKMHHAHVNLSLMQSWGNLQRVKSEPKENELENNGKAKALPLDRPDVFLCKLNEFYKTDPECRKLPWLRLGYRSPLHGYLERFSDIYDYCTKVYLLRGDSGRKLVDKMVDNGRRAIVSKEDLGRFMDLALAFWMEKARNLARIGH